METHTIINSLPCLDKTQNATSFRISYRKEKRCRRRNQLRSVCCKTQNLSHFDPEEVIKSVGKSLWGNGLPPGLLVSTVREGWTAAWKVMMSQLAPQSKSGSYERPKSAFRGRILKGGEFPPEEGRYHLYAALSCPWAHRTLVVHTLKGLSEAVPLSVASPSDSGLWEFRKSNLSMQGNVNTIKPSEDRANGCRYVKEVYGLQSGGFNGRSTLPMLWDSKTKKVVNNESAEIIEILNSAFDEYAENPDVNLQPEELKADIAKWNDEIYEHVNNGVYRCGFATSQEAYSQAVEQLFVTLDKIDEHLGCHRYLCGDSLTLADIRLFTTLFRFDAVYSPLYKCTRKKVSEYPNLSGYLRDLYQVPGISSTCDIDSVLNSYFVSLFPLNPGGIVPILPYNSSHEALLMPHHREILDSSGKATV